MEIFKKIVLFVFLANLISQVSFSQETPESLYLQGKKYENGEGVEKNITKALDFYKQSAEKGNPKAYFAIGSLYVNGKHLPQNLRLAANNYLKALSLGEKEALTALDKLDLATLVDTESYEYILYKTVRFNDAESNYKLGKLFLEGKNGAPKDFQKAYEYLHKAAMQEHIKAILTIGRMYASGNSYIPQNWESSFKWYRKAAYLGSDSAAFFMGVAYQEGKGVEKDDKRAVRWYLIAANKGIKEAEEQLSKYDIEQYIESSDLEFALYRANRKDLNAMLLVAQYFLKQEKSEAIDWLNMLAEKKVVEAFRLLGDIYAEGKCGVEKNYAEAAKWYEKGESAGDNIATRKLIFLYADSLVGGEKAKDIAKEKATQFVEKNKNVPKTQKELYQDILLLNKILGDINFQKKEYRQAIKHYDFYIRNYEDSLQSPDYLIESFYNMGRSSAGMKNWEEAAHYLDLALSTTKQYEKILSNPKSKKADILYERGCVAFEAYKLKQENIYKVCEFFQLARELGKPTPEEIRTECIMGKSGG